MSRPPLIVLAFIVATYVTNLFSRPAHGQQQQQDYSDLTGGLLASNEDSQSIQEEQQQTQSLQSILSKLIPSVWAEKPKREPPPLVPSTSPSALAFAATRVKLPPPPPSTAGGINGHGNVSSGTDNVGSSSEQQSTQVQQIAYVTPADRDYATTNSINSLDSGYWASNGLGSGSGTGSKQQLAAPYDSYTGPTGGGDPHHQHQHQSGWSHSNRYFATPTVASPPPPPPSPARQVISVNSNRLFYPPPSPSTSLNQQATAIEQQSSNQQQINLASYSNNPPVPIMTASQYSPHPFWSPQSQSGPAYSLGGGNGGGEGGFYNPPSIFHHQQVSPAAAAYHHQLATSTSFNPAIRSPNHHNPYHPFPSSSYLAPSTLSESTSSLSSSSPASFGSSLLASLATNKADITNLIKLLPLIAQTVSMLPRVLNPSTSNGGAEIDTRTQFELASNGSQKPGAGGGGGGTSGSSDPASSSPLSAWGSQAASLIKAVGSLALASAQQQQQQQQQSLPFNSGGGGGDLLGGTLAGFMSRWPAGASLIGALLRNAAASWWPTVVSRAQEVEFVANRSRLRNQAIDHHQHQAANTINLDTQTQASQTTKQPRQQASDAHPQKVGRIP